MREEIIGDCRLILGDCRDILPTLGPVDAVVTDPPYGIGEAWGKGAGWQGSCGKGRLWVGQPDWDVAPEAELLVSLIGQPAIIWGGNYFPSLPTSKAWLVWDKCADMVQAHAELAWTNCAPTVRTYRKSPLGAFGNGGANGEVKNHPTQKPIDLIEWCLGFLPNARTILDPFMGSGTTGVACALTDRAFIGIDREPSYFEISCRRIEEAYKQPRLFAEPVQKPVQNVLI
jgi:hypothetical protein